MKVLEWNAVGGKWKKKEATARIERKTMDWKKKWACSRLSFYRRRDDKRVSMTRGHTFIWCKVYTHTISSLFFYTFLSSFFFSHILFVLFFSSLQLNSSILEWKKGGKKVILMKKCLQSSAHKSEKKSRFSMIAYSMFCCTGKENHTGMKKQKQFHYLTRNTYIKKNLHR